MLSLNFNLDQLGSAHRSHWVNLMRRERAKPVFLWGPARWASDYLITVVHPYYTNLYAFSANNFEAAARLTPEVTDRLLDWLGELWHTSAVPDDDSTPLTTW
jgi:hypothetical protein